MAHVNHTTETATFAAGCFWGVEAAFREIEGVESTRVGYTGGHAPSPGYKQVCRGKTGHAEAVEVSFDPERVSYERLLDLFWSIHNPTTLNRQGWDFGSQYRSAIFTHGEQQATAAQASFERAQERTRRRIVTEIAPASEFWQAEDYHQQYLEKRGQASCAVGVA
ncbi:MAG: peptide-methionine (S)-S-oxide reductase MsrA [Solirubrobacterales bacterium]|nr:peptide-methionine (S)-S-oxide reductase MsrA [Solirubrobacterales bacterium]MCO5327672.1 peptide-methionine (S)-S-oxide reductase MsrA [Solirubrobacterales bacterium]